MSGTTHIYLNPVQAERCSEFEQFLATTAQPAVEAQRPHLRDRWQVLRATEPQDGVVTYAFVFEDGDLDEDWELGSLLSSHLGEEEAERRITEWLATFAPLEEWTRIAGSGNESGQVGWSFERVLP